MAINVKYDPALGWHFHAGGTVSDKLLIFDIDDTIIYSNANVKIMRNGKYEKSITSAQFNTYHLRRGETFDYSEFESFELLNTAIVTKYWHTLCREYKKGTHICILTARSSRDTVKKFLLNKGIDIKDALIMCCGDPNYMFSGDVNEKKAKSIDYLHTLGYKTFVFFDDNIYNLLSAKELEEKYTDIKIKTVHVKL